MNKKNIVIHIGLHKTGTTFLQKEVFPKLDKEKVNFVNLTGQDNADTILGKTMYEDKINLISREGLSGFPYEIEKDYPSMNEELRTCIAKNLAKLYPNARIIIGVRDKDDWLYSLYKQHAKMKPNLMNFKNFREKFDDSYLDFEGYITLLRKLFPNGVYVYQYENLKKDYYSFVDGICKFIGVETPDNIENIVYNKSWSEGQVEIITALFSFARKGYLLFRHIMEKSNRGEKK